MTISQNKGPSIAELQRFIRESVRLEFMLSTGESLTGRLRWFDDDAFSLVVNDGEQPFTILRTAVVGYRALSRTMPAASPAAAGDAARGNQPDTASAGANGGADDKTEAPPAAQQAREAEASS